MAGRPTLTPRSEAGRQAGAGPVNGHVSNPVVLVDKSTSLRGGTFLSGRLLTLTSPDFYLELGGIPCVRSVHGRSNSVGYLGGLEE